MADPAPFILQKPLLHVGDAVTGVDIQCSANNVDAKPDQDTNTVETFCGSYTSYKAEKWTITITALQSYGTDGLWTKLRPLCNTVVAFELMPDADAIASVDNPTMTGTAILKGFPFMSGGVGEAMEFDLELGVQGEPVFATVLTQSAA